MFPNYTGNNIQITNHDCPWDKYSVYVSSRTTNGHRRLLISTNCFVTVEFLFPISPARLLLPNFLTIMSKTERFFYKKQELLAISEDVDSPPQFWWYLCCSLYISFLYCVTGLFVFVPCLVSNFASVSGLSIRDCSFGFL